MSVTTKERFNRKMVKMPPSGIRRFFEMITGRDDIISLSVGEPDFPTPWHMREEAFYYMERGRTSYTSNWGTPELRAEIAKYLARYNLDYSPTNEILVTIGVSEAVDAVLRAVLNPGDEIIACEPCYVSYQPLAELCDATIVHLDTSATSFIPTAETIAPLVTAKTKALMLCSPSNPTGRMIPAAELAKIAALAVEHDLWVISDEVYCELVYDGNKHVSIASFPGMKERTAVCNGFSKAFAMTGWRIGYVAGPADLLGLVFKLHQYSTICAPIMSQYAAAEGLKNGWAEVEKMRASYQQRRNLMLKAFAEMGYPVTNADGAFYLFPDIRKTGLTSEEFSKKLITDYAVAMVPGSVFGPSGEGYQRCCYATDLEKIKVALDRISQMTHDLGV
jgi:aminotransferase